MPQRQENLSHYKSISYKVSKYLTTLPILANV